MALDSASQQFIAVLAAAGSPPIHESTPAIARMSGPIFAGMSGPGPDVAEVDNFRLTADDGTTFRMRVLKPEGEIKSVIVYLHGGGWVIGDIDLQYDHLARVLANATSSAVVLVNYRKAPEHRFPAAIDDAYQGLQWAAEHLEEIAGRPVPLIVAGDSAGGNLSAALTLRARESGPTIDFQVLVYPVTDADFDRPSYVAEENQLLLARPTMQWFWNHYLPDPAERRVPDATPLSADSLAGLPPAFVLLAEHDVLHDEGREYAEALQSAGVPTEVEVAEGQMHAFFQMIGVLPGSQAGIDRVAEKINQRIAALAKE